MLGVETVPTLGAPDPLMNSDLVDSENEESDEELPRSKSIKLKQKRLNKTRLILSDDEDEEMTPTLSDQGKSQSDGEEMKESDAGLEKADNLNQDREKQNILDDDSSSDDMGVNNKKPKERKKIRRPVDSSDDDDDDADDVSTKSKTRKKIQRPVESSDDNDDASSDEDENDKPKEKKKIRRPIESSDDSEDESDLSNDENNDDNPKQKKKVRKAFGSSGDSNSSEEEEEEGEIAFQLAASPQDPEAENDGSKKSMRRKRISKDHLQEIHSETQRIVRESSIRLPYHRPKPLSLDELFNKKPSLTTLKPIGTRVPRIHGKQLLDTSLEQDSRKENSKKESDELPNVLSSQTNESPSTDNLSENNTETSPKDAETEDEASKTEADKVDTIGEAESVDEPMETEDGVNGAQTGEDDKTVTETEPSPTSPSPSKEKDASPVKTTQDHPTESPPSLDTPQQELNEAPVFKTPTCTTSTRPDPQSSQARRMQRLQDSLNRLKGVQPKLSGGPKITIDLDEGSEPSPEDKGVAKLMKRFVKHTKHVKKTHQKDVKVNVVTKEKGEDGKEDLKHHTLTVGLDSKPDAIELSTNIPGAKLGLLKENLQATMKVKREQERLKRREAFRLDNEEGFEDEDEAELTEGSDTEEEEEGEKEKRRLIGDEDDDEDYEPGNEFVDDEAESDGDSDDADDDDDEMGDDMEDEEEEENTPIKKLKKKSLSDKSCDLMDSDDEISPSRRKGSKKRAMVVDDVEDGVNEEKGITLRRDSTETDDTDTEISDAMQDSGRFVSGSLVRTPRSASALDQCSKTMEMFDSATNSSEFQVPISRTDSSNKRVSWGASKDTDSSKDSIGFVLPAPVRQDSSSNSMDTSFEAMTSLIPAHQPEGGMRRSGRASVDSTKGESFTPFSKHQSVLSNICAKTVSRNELSLPVEDSQDLFREDSPRLPIITDSQPVTESQSFHFSFEETQTQFLDENGLLNLKPSSSTKKKPMFDDTQTHNAESQSSMDELLGLCSGQFTATQDVGDSKAEKPGPFSQVSQRPGTQANMDELLNLCSGTFTELASKSQISSTRIMDDHKSEKDDDERSFHIASDPDGPDSDDDIDKVFSDEDIAPKKRRRIVQQESDDDEEDDEDERKGEESDLDSEFDFGVNREKFKGKTYGKKLNLANFVEDEAELSGSEVDSDENYDAEDEPDDEDLEGIVNEEMGNQDELRDQVNKVHLKTMDDDDARRLRIFKEMYLPDGDLHSDNKGRERKFRWRHMESQIDMFRPGSDGEEDEEDAEDQDTQWRLQRYQREQWLKENQDKSAAVTPEVVTPPVEENSQFAKCLRAATIKKSQEPAPPDVSEKEKEKDKGVAITKPLKIMSSRGSFLSRSKTDLAKMASMLKPVSNPQAPRNNKNFVFHSAEPSATADENVKEPPKVKRSASVSGPSRTPSGPQAKRPRLERSQSQFTSGSVFRHF